MTRISFLPILAAAILAVASSTATAQVMPGQAQAATGSWGQFSAPGQGMPGQGMPGQGMPGQGMPGQGMPGQGMPGQGMPGQSMPGMPGMPGQGMPSSGMPSSGMPSSGMPGQGMPPGGEAPNPATIISCAAPTRCPIAPPAPALPPSTGVDTSQFGCLSTCFAQAGNPLPPLPPTLPHTVLAPAVQRLQQCVTPCSANGNAQVPAPTGSLPPAPGAPAQQTMSCTDACMAGFFQQVSSVVNGGVGGSMPPGMIAFNGSRMLNSTAASIVATAASSIVVVALASLAVIA